MPPLMTNEDKTFDGSLVLKTIYSFWGNYLTENSQLKQFFCFYYNCSWISIKAASKTCSAALKSYRFQTLDTQIEISFKGVKLSSHKFASVLFFLQFTDTFPFQFSVFMTLLTVL